MHRRGFLTAVGAVGGAGLAAPGCTSAPDDATGTNDGHTGPPSPGITPGKLPTPSFGPSVGPIATALAAVNGKGEGMFGLSLAPPG